MQLQTIKDEICDIGRRLYNKGFAAANDGNISYRVDENRVVCTPTQICKGFMKPEDLCIVDMRGDQLAGHRKKTSEIMLHLTIMKERPEVKSVVHCHPPHATAFGIAREAIPQCVLPEVDLFMGDVPIAKYAAPGSQKFADTILPFIHKTDIIVQANHGTVSLGPTVERAYWLTELLDAYCRILLIARDLGRVEYFNKDEAEELLDLKSQWGVKDPRSEMTDCKLCANDVFRETWKETGVGHRAFSPPHFRRGEECVPNGLCSRGTAPGSCCAGTEPCPNTGKDGCSRPPGMTNGAVNTGGNAGVSPEQEALIQAITSRILAALNRS